MVHSPESQKLAQLRPDERLAQPYRRVKNYFKRLNMGYLSAFFHPACRHPSALAEILFARLLLGENSPPSANRRPAHHRRYRSHRARLSRNDEVSAFR